MIDDIRRDNMALLVDEFVGLSALANKLDRSDSQVSQWVNGSAHSATGRKRGMRPETARYIESRCGKHPGWLDIDHSSSNTIDRIRSIFDQLSPARKSAAEQALLGLLALENDERRAASMKKE